MRKIKGKITSDNMQKTVVVETTNLRKHSKYEKYFKVTKKFKAHDEKGEYKVGDEVIIRETRPRSKYKRWEVSELVSRPPANKSDAESEDKNQ